MDGVEMAHTLTIDSFQVVFHTNKRQRERRHVSTSLRGFRVQLEVHRSITAAAATLSIVRPSALFCYTYNISCIFTVVSDIIEE
jgi:ribonucleotide monophosphatase NagD (HAD superfamily)